MVDLPEEYREAKLQRMAELNAQLMAIVAELEAIMAEALERLDQQGSE